MCQIILTASSFIFDIPGPLIVICKKSLENVSDHP